MITNKTNLTYFAGFVYLLALCLILEDNVLIAICKTRRAKASQNSIVHISQLKIL